ncbi:MAG: hypothetical protein ACLP1X_00130 [Polyangiaceae bacterium]|jgi:hypothetical protein
MGDFVLRYRAGVLLSDLRENECTIHRATTADRTATYWLLWFYVRRGTDQELEDFAVPIIPRGTYQETGPGGRSWGFTDQGGGVWALAPSINVLQSAVGKMFQPGEHPALPSLWHKTPSVENVPTGEPWQ